MTAQSGKDLLLKMNIDGSYITMAGIRSSSLSFNAAMVDITNASSLGQWRELLSGSGVKSASISGSGVFRDETSDAQMRSLFFQGDVRDWQIIIPDFGVVSGAFQLTSLEYSGTYDGEVTFSVSLASAGSLNFTSI